MSVVRHMLVDERRQSFDGVEVRAIRRQLNEVNAAVRPCEECPDIRSFRTGGVIPDDMDDNMPDDMPEDMDDALVGVASPCPGEKLRGADPIDGRRLDKGGVEGFEVERAMDIHPSASSGGLDRGV